MGTNLNFSIAYHPQLGGQFAMDMCLRFRRQLGITPTFGRAYIQ